MTTTYESINSLGLRIHQDPIAHVTWWDIAVALSATEHQEFQRWMENKTCIAEGAYAWDVEKFLNRLKGS